MFGFLMVFAIDCAFRLGSTEDVELYTVQQRYNWSEFTNVPPMSNMKFWKCFWGETLHACIYHDSKKSRHS